MTFETFKLFAAQAQQPSETLEKFLQVDYDEDLMQLYTDQQSLNEALTYIYLVFGCENSFKNLLKICQITPAAFAAKYDIPLRSCYNWIAAGPSRREISPYLLNLLAYSELTSKSKI